MDDFHAGRIELVDSVSDNQDVFGAGFGGDGFEDHVLEIGDIGKKELAVEANQNDRIVRGQLGMNADVPEGSVPEASEDGDPGTHGTEQVEENGKPGADDDSLVQLGGEGQGGDECYQGSEAVMPVRVPYVDDGLQVHQADDGHHDHGSQHRLGKVVEE